ncbi:hypothetical protein B0H17DRAFT_1154880 [Mycena rosella]|uniref:Transcription factor domain-containing protein n=1 Tax=Mycena rosella TaxID=1033263 RepID=A0AAD7AX82_MYCRO|nr:hypothetical protein B0H17DRAFT_1154880 [Mycena rosella]
MEVPIFLPAVAVPPSPPDATRELIRIARIAAHYVPLGQPSQSEVYVRSGPLGADLLTLASTSRPRRGTLQLQPPQWICTPSKQRSSSRSTTWTTGALEGRYHCAAATSLAFTARLHQVQRGSAPHPHPPFVLSDAALRSHRIFPKKEQIDAFWSIVILNNYWVAASSLPSSIPCDTSIGSLYAEHPQVLNEGVDSPLPRVPHSRPATEFFRARLAPAPPTDTRALVTHALVNVALIRLHGYGPNCLSAAGCVVAQLQNTHFSDWDRVDPILVGPASLGLCLPPLIFSHPQPLLSAVADVYIAHLTLPTADSNTTLSADLNTVLSSLSALARGSALVHSQQRYQMMLAARSV